MINLNVLQVDSISSASISSASSGVFSNSVLKQCFLLKQTKRTGII